jgi:hypothetical protein
MNKPLVVFTTLNDKMVMCIGGTYYEKIPFSKILTQRMMIGSVLFFILNGFALFLFSVVQFIRRKYALLQTLINSLPVMACLFLMVSFQQLFHVREFSYLLADLSMVGIRSITIFGCTLMFAALNVGAGCLAMKRLQDKRNFLNWYYAIIVVSLMITTVYLSIQGIIGLRSWAM